MSLKLITAPTAPPVTLAEMKEHLRVDMADDDTLISAMLVGATDIAEQYTGRAIMPQTWEITLDAFPDAFEITRVPAASVTTLKYWDAAGTQQTLSNSLYALDNADEFGAAYVVPVYNGTWPDTRAQINAVTLRYLAGYADATAVPESIKAWIKLMVGAMYENRELEAGRQTFTLGFADRLLDRYKVWTL